MATKEKKINFDKLFKVLCNNVTMYPVIAQELSEELGVTVESINKLGVGFHFKFQAWAFAERDHKGNVIGICLRGTNGKKFMVPGSKHGLFYEVNTGSSEPEYKPGAHNWTRVDKNKGISCPICGKYDGCAVASSNPTDPPAVMCVHISKGSVKPVELGHLHILKKGGIINQQTILMASQHPILVVEGASDVLAAMDLGFTAIGRPSASSGMEILAKMPLYKKEVWVIGENDAGVGESGMQRAFATIQQNTNKVTMFQPPEGIKDFRKWKAAGLTQNALFEYAKEYGKTDQNDSVFESNDSLLISKKFLEAKYIKGDNLLLRLYKGRWVQFVKNAYRWIDDDELQGRIYGFIDGKQFQKATAKGDINLIPISTDIGKIKSITNALKAINDTGEGCPILNCDPPAWIDGGEHTSPADLLTFKNGRLDVNEYIDGKIVLHNPDPNLFTFNVFPYDFDENAESKLFKEFRDDIFETDPIRDQLLAQWFGYNLVPDTSLDALLILFGKTRAGKSTLLGVLENMLGKDQCAAMNYRNLISRFGLESLIGRTACILGDVSTANATQSNEILEELKRVSGSDGVNIDRKHRSALDNVHLTLRFTMAMNNLPVFVDDSGAWLSRIKIIDFDKSYVGKEDPTLRTRLIKEAAEGKMINYALRGLKDLRERGEFITPDSSRPILRSISEISRPVLTFVNECCEIGEEHCTNKRILYDIWRGWCDRTGNPYSKEAQFGRDLLSISNWIESDRVRDKGSRVMMYRGIAPTKEAIDLYAMGK